MRPFGLLFFLVFLAPVLGYVARSSLDAATALFHRELNQSHNTVVDMMVQFFGADNCTQRTSDDRLSLICRDKHGSVHLVSTSAEDPVAIKLKVCQPIDGSTVCDTIYPDVRESA